MTTEEAIKALNERGAQRYDGLKIKSVSLTATESGDRFCLTLDKPVTSIRNTGSTTEPNWEEVSTRQVFVFVNSVIATLTDNTSAARIRAYLKNTPYVVADLITDATISIMSEKVNAGDTYVNPFSDSGKEYEVKNDQYFHSIVSITMDEDGEDAVKEIRRDIRRGKIKFNDHDDD